MASATSAGKVQHVPKASSDELLRKFADADSPKKKARLIRAPPARRRRPPPRRAPRAAPSGDRGPGSEWKALLQHPPSRRAALLRRVGIRPALGAGEIAGLGLLLTALGKTWRKTVEGTSRMLVEKKHGGRHVRLISGGDAV